MTTTPIQWTTWQYLARVVRYRPMHFAWNVVLWTLFHSMPAVYGLITKAIFDAISGHSPVGLNVWTLLAIMLTINLTRVGVFRLAFNTFISYYLIIEAYVRQNLLDYLMNAPKSRVMPESSSEAVSRFRDDSSDLARYAENWIDLGGIVLYIGIAIGVMFSVDGQIAFVVTAPLFLMMLLMRQLSPVIRTYRRRMRAATSAVTDFIGEAFNAVQAVKVASKEDSMTAKFDSLGETRRKAALKDVLLVELIRSANNGLVGVGTGIVLFLAATKIHSGAFTVGDFALFMQYLPTLTGFLTFLGDIMAQHKRVKVSTDRIEHLLQDASPEVLVAYQPLYFDSDIPKPEEVPESRVPLQELRVEGLSYHYQGSQNGIHNISLTIKRGDFVVITGRIGSGKTTFLRVLQGLLPKGSGEIFWNGAPVASPADFFRPPHSAYTAQVPRLFSEELKHNILIGEDKIERLERSLDLAVMRPDIETLEHGLDTVVGTRGVKLSGGQVQRASAARMFTRDADILIFDDLSSALDVQTEKQLWEGLFADRATTCLVVSHRKVALSQATHIIVLKDGAVESSGSLAELLATSKEMQKLWDEEI